jgi:Polyketide cyclase / dehydrase and lipid transport
VSGRRYIARRVRDVAAPPAVVFALLSDSSTYPQWAPVEGYEMERPGFDTPHGVGEIRVLFSGMFRVREEVVELVPGKFMAYTLLSGLPMRDYRGETTLDLLPDGGTRIIWQSNFNGVAGTGPLMRLLMLWILWRLTGALARAAESRAASAADNGDISRKSTSGSVPA